MSHCPALLFLSAGLLYTTYYMSIKRKHPDRLIDVVRKEYSDASHHSDLFPHISGKNLLKYLLTGLVLFSFLIGPVQAPHSSAQEELAEQNQDRLEERAELEKQLAEYERQIEETQATIQEYRKQGNTLKNEISALNATINKLNLQIKAINVSISKLNQEINNTQREINKTENTIDDHKEALAGALQSVYETDHETLITILLANEKLSDFFGRLNDIELIQNNLRIALEEIVKLRQELLSQKEELALEKQDVENFKAIQQRQKSNVQYTQNQKSDLLDVTKGKESEYQKVLEETKATAAEIRSRIFELLGGGELTFEKAYDFAQIAESATGVRAALILAILHRESLLGKNVGRCPYYSEEKSVYYMHPTRDVPYFLDLLERLGVDPQSEFAKVSCPNQHGTYGGAMGPAQFIPSTWKIYEDDIGKVTGNVPPSPWSNSDAFAATGVYMQDLLNSSGCQKYGEDNKHLVPKQTLVERCAAAKYYSGGNWYKYRFWYGDPVVQKANEFERDIAVLEGE